MESGQYASPVGVKDRFQQQQAHTVNVNYDGIAAVPEAVILTSRALYRPYPEYHLGYDHRQPPRAVCKQFPGICSALSYVSRC